MSTINTHTHTVSFVDGQVWMYSIQNTVSTRNGPSPRTVIEKTLCSLPAAARGYAAPCHVDCVEIGVECLIWFSLRPARAPSGVGRGGRLNN